MPHRPSQALVSLAAALAATPGLAADAAPLSATEATLVHFAYARLRLRAGAMWAGVEDLYGRRGDFGRVEAGAYRLAEWYVDQPDEPVPLRSLTGEPAPRQFELGFTLGTEPPARLWRFPLPRVGVAWRFGTDLSVFRVVFGSAF